MKMAVANNRNRCRSITQDSDVFQHNAWDDVNWTEDQIVDAERRVSEAASTLMSPEQAIDLHRNAASNWDKFYGIHNNRFFKDRNWLRSEFPELFPSVDGSCAGTTSLGGSFTVFEVGCGVGNTVIPILQSTKDSPVPVFVYACDFSSVAIDIVKAHPSYDVERSLAFVCDLTAPNYPIPEGSLDCIVMVFALSAIDPSHHLPVLEKLARLLKPKTGLLLFRDYGRFDMAQLRFKSGRCIKENFYARGDGTFSYFFTQEELDTHFVNVGLVKELNYIDRRLQVNRGKMLKMYRCWIHCKYRRQ